MKRKIEEKLLQWADNSKIVIHVATEVTYKVKKTYQDDDWRLISLEVWVLN